MYLSEFPETILLFRKPLEGTIVDNVLKHNVGGINIDGCRIGINGATKRSHQADFQNKGIKGEVHATRGYRVGHEILEINKGRFPANIILSHHSKCEFVGYDKISVPTHNHPTVTVSNFCHSSREKPCNRQKYDYSKNGKETIEQYKCHKDCVFNRFPETITGNRDNTNNKPYLGPSGWKGTNVGDIFNGSSGSASRYFYCVKNRQELIEYIIKLITPKDGVVKEIK